MIQETYPSMTTLRKLLGNYERLLNEEFPWNPDDLSDVDPVEGPPIRITAEMVLEATTKMARL